MLHPSKRGIICDLSGEDHLISAKEPKLVYHTVSITNGDKNLLDLDITTNELNKLIVNINKPICKLCGSNTNVNDTVVIKNIEARPDHNDVNENTSFKICDACFAKLRQQVINVAEKNNEKVRKFNEQSIRPGRN